MEEEQELDSGHTLPEVGELEAETENVLPPIPIDVIFSRLGGGGGGGGGGGTEYSSSTETGLEVSCAGLLSEFQLLVDQYSIVPSYGGCGPT